MTIELEQTLRHHYRSVADELELTPLTFDELRARTDGVVLTANAPTGSRTTRRPPAWLGVAAGLTALVVGLTAITLFGGDVPEPPTLLTSVDDVEPTDWVAASVLPDGLTWRYALLLDDADGARRMTVYGSDRIVGQDERLHIELAPASAVTGADPVDIAGTTWMIATIGDASWVGTRQLGSTAVTVRDRGAFDDLDRALLAGLVSVSDDGLPSTPLGDDDRRAEVAMTEFEGARYSLSAQESNGYWCFSVDSAEGRSGGCAGSVDPDASITINGGSTSRETGSDVSEVVLAGTTTSDVTRVEVQFRDGTVVEVIPTDLSGNFDRSFWIAAATVMTGPESQPAEARAYDAAGDLLGTATTPP